MIDSLLDPRCIFVSSATSQLDAFVDIAHRLEALNYVKSGFLDALIARERSYPTGIDMSPLGTSVPSFAVPHTDPDYVNVTRVVPIKLANHVKWHDMVNPEAHLSINFAFMILNHSGDTQVQILSQIMDAANKLGADGLNNLFAETSEEAIYNTLSPYFIWQ